MTGGVGGGESFQFPSSYHPQGSGLGAHPPPRDAKENLFQ